MGKRTKIDAFIDEYMIDGNGTRAATVAGYSPKTANEQASRMLANVNISNEVARRRAIISAKNELKVDDVVRNIKSVIRADPRDLIEYRRASCRHCHGIGFMYQYTPQEFRDAYMRHMESKEYLVKGVSFNPQGGEGYNPNKDPHEDCPECFGDGVGRAFARDTRTLSSDAVAIYAGVKETQHGVEVLIRSKDAAIKQAALYLGMNKQEVNVMLGTKAKDLTNDELAAIAKGDIIHQS